jgi:hypothetical protein
MSKFIKAILQIILIISLLIIISCNKDKDKPAGNIQLLNIKVGSTSLNFTGTNPGILVSEPVIISFDTKIDTNSAKNSIHLIQNQNNIISGITFSADFKSVTLTPAETLISGKNYVIQISADMKGADGETFTAMSVQFTTENGDLLVTNITINGLDFSLENQSHPKDINRENMVINVTFNRPLNPLDYASYFFLSGYPPLTVNLSQDQKTVTVTNDDTLEGYTKYYFSISGDLTPVGEFPFDGYYTYFYTSVDSTLKFPLISDEELLTLVESQTFKYFYDFAQPTSGMARERNTSGTTVTTGGSGFGVMALIVGMERGFITRQQGLERLDKVLTFLETCDRFHGAWPHWLNGATGAVVPFSTKDDGADLVETAYMVQGLMTMRQYLHPGVQEEDSLISRLNGLMDGVEWDWFRHGGQNVLYWHWSPNYNWDMNMPIRGYNETLIVYIMAATSQTHSIPQTVYTAGYARNGGIVNGSTYYGYILPLGGDYGGPLFFSQYSHLGLDPRNLSDQYANYWEQGVNMSLINWAYCADNPKNWLGYRSDCWGLTASDNPWGYNAQSPTNDLGVITPTAAVSALPYTPEQSMDAIRHFYYILGDKLWGDYGFYDSFDITESWWADSYLAIDQGPIVCMVENYRTGLLWDLFMSAPEVQQGLTTLGFSY